jgi:cytochrome c-type biogenesis protein CcmH/NrfG
MAQSLKPAGCLLLGVLLAGCSHMATKTPTQRLNHVLTTQQQAEAAYRSNDMQHAEALYLQLTRMIPQEADYWYMLGNTYVRTQQPDNAVQAFQQAILRNPNHARAWHNLGIVRMRQATAAFVSSASTAKADDPLQALSTHLADELARIGTGSANSGKTRDRVSMATPRPDNERARTATVIAAAPDPAAAESWSSAPNPVSKRP